MNDSSCMGLVARTGKRRILLLVLLGLLAGIGGCTRAFYRKQTDNEVNEILAEKDKIPGAPIEMFHVYPDPRARFADPRNPDRPSQPPDDPDANRLAPHPQNPGKPGVGNVEGTAYLEMIKTWDEQNRAERKANAGKDNADEPSGEGLPAPSETRTGPVKTFFDEPLNAARKGFLLTLDQAVELGVVNAREYQDFREDLYVAALPVSLARFSFAYQWAATENAVRTWAGPLSPVGTENQWSLGSNASFTKLFSTGALLTFGFANSTVFNFATPHGLSTSSTIDLSFVQPLLQGGGRAVALEPLTQTERNLVYSVRSYARFREQFFVNVAIGSGLPNSLSSAVGSGTTGSPISTLAAVGLASTDVAGGFVSYLSTLYREVDMAADKKYKADLEKAIKLFEGLQEGGQVSPLQVSQVQSTLLNARNAVLTDEQFVNNALDQFKLVLGLPTNLPLVLDDSACRAITRQLDRYYEVIGDSDVAYKLVEDQERLPPEKLRAFLEKTYTTHILVRGTDFQNKILPSWGTWAKATDKEVEKRLQMLQEQRRKLLDEKTDVEAQGKTLTEAQSRYLRETEFEADLGLLEANLRRYEARPWEKLAKEQQPVQRLKLFRLVAYQAEIVLVWGRNDRFNQVTQQWPELVHAPLDDLDLLTEDVDRAQEEAVKVALTNRWDLMNARAQVVDAWRQIRVTANALLGAFNVGYNLESTTLPGRLNPFAFSAHGTEQQLSLDLQLPLNRVAQRNAYRVAIINYQQARRGLMKLEDNIAAQVRFDVRQLHLFAENYKIQKFVLQSFYSQVENALEVLVAPADPDQLKQTGTSGAAAAAALTTQYLTALGGLNNAQTKMYDIWLSYIATRMQLYLDLERLPLDNRGVWIDESGNTADTSRPCSGPPRSERGPVLPTGAAPANDLHRAHLVAPQAPPALE